MYGLYKNASEVMQHIVTKFVIKPLAAAYLVFSLKKGLYFFSKLRNACKEIINKIDPNEKAEGKRNKPI